MSRKKTVIDAELQALYDQVPDTGCKGLCHHVCTAIDASARERQKIRAAGVHLPEAGAMKNLNQGIEGYRCPALVDERCSVYEVRPMICRLDGGSEALPCHYGCQPEGGRLSAAQTFRLLVESMAAGGHPGATPAWRMQMLADLEDPRKRQKITEALTEHARTVGHGPGPWARITTQDKGPR